ncbi:MerC domain-containing protein [Pseudoduganella lutea]|uniref:MerC domain-containing protein n=1 Tax=Pseudoduganella lutea TaxID=321985 RepID=A0A4P6L222_9BURK|nr:MerC domain-containing protein [Pseudoduganella lutea]QBE65437.1 MerC domain-containing protein [Pseudoduganella lutea]
MNKLTGAADAAGLFASTLCMIHCLAMPVLLAVLPAMSWASDEHAHEVLLAVALGAAVLSLGPGYRAHRRLAVPLLGGAGLACLAIAMFVVEPRYGHGAEAAVSVAGALLLFGAHVRNRICCRRCVDVRIFSK